MMNDRQSNHPSNSIPKRKENVRVFVHRRRRTTKPRKRIFRHSSSSSNSHETVPSSPNNLKELMTLIENQMNNKQDKSHKNKNIIVVNYKPVFINSRQEKSLSTANTAPTPIAKPVIIPTDDDFSSATHYSRRRSLTTTSSDGSPRRSTTSRSNNHQSVSLDLPDVEDPLMFIEMMYQQLFTEDGRLRSGTEPTALANCVKQIVRHSRRNSMSSSIVNGSTSSLSKHINVNTSQQRQVPSPLYHQQHYLLSSPSPSIPNEQYNSTSEENDDDEEDDDEEEEEPNTLIQVNHQRPTIVVSTDTSKNSIQTDLDNHSQIHAFLNSCHQKSTTVNRSLAASNGFRFSLDDTDNEDFDTFSDLNSIRFNNKTIGTSPSVDDDLTHTDSRFLSSSGYHSLDHSSKIFKASRARLTKSHSENDLIYTLYKSSPPLGCIHYCPECVRPPKITVIPPVTSGSSTTTTNLIQRIQQPLGEMVMKYLNFILISKNVLLLPLFIFLLRQRSLRLGN
ncbi:unnamed protein product [Adineta ricciae]|uniref:Uncharacterized protein n=1 Tax=Adineta ricciae TaxID=249248 RepID=A0A814YV71_ADIRI|nr:unnamed protein product [Adineta ricciae]